MKVFISWSGDRSRAVASLLSDWLQCVIQTCRPWISTRDIGRGALWFSEIGQQLSETTVGVVCLTEENKNKPWILFEAGALAKGLTSSRVCTLLVDLTPGDLDDPLAQFNHTTPTREGLWELVRTLNTTSGESALPDRILAEVFDTYWPKFQQQFEAALAAYPPAAAAPPKTDKDVLAEILAVTKSLGGRLSALERETASIGGFLPLVAASKGTGMIHSPLGKGLLSEDLQPMTPKEVAGRISKWRAVGLTEPGSPKSE
jgi:hypothetical protein